MDERQPIEIERQRSVAEIIGEALDVYQRHPLLFMALALGVIAPYQLGVLAATGLGPLASGSGESAEVRLLLFLLDYVLVAPLVSALHIHAVVLIGKGGRPRLADVVARGLRVLPVVVAAVIVAGLGIALGLVALIVPGIVLALRWAVVGQVAAVEHQGWIPSLTRSAELTRERYGHILGVLIVTGLLSAGVSVLAQLIPLGSSSGVASVAVGIALRTVTASFSALTLALLYFDLRARRAAPALQQMPRPDPQPELDPQPEPDPQAGLDPQPKSAPQPESSPQVGLEPGRESDPRADPEPPART